MEGKLRSWPRRSRGCTGSALELDRLGGCRPPLATTPQHCPRSQFLPAHRAMQGRLVWPLPGETLPGAVVLALRSVRGLRSRAQPTVPAPRPASSLFRPLFPHLQTGPTRTSQDRAVSQYLLLTHCVFSKQSLVLLEHLIFNRFVFPKKRRQQGFIMHFKR